LNARTLAAIGSEAQRGRENAQLVHRHGAQALAQRLEGACPEARAWLRGDREHYQGFDLTNA